MTKEQATPAKIAEVLEVEHHAISGRFKRLRDHHGAIRKTGDRKDGAAVYELVFRIPCSCTKSLKYEDVSKGVQ